MENPCKIICFGDSITKGYAPYLEKYFRKNFPEIRLDIINEGVGGETTIEGLVRVGQILEQKPDVVVIGFGMNDAFKRTDINKKEFCQNLSLIIDKCEEENVRAHVLTLHPINGDNYKLRQFNNLIRSVCKEKSIKLIDVHWFWEQKLKNPKKGLKDAIHPNEIGNEIYAEAVFRIASRPKTILEWQYNGNPCNCNYACPYCQYPTLEQKGDYFFGTVEQWHDAFKKAFGKQQLVFYFAHGEPTIGKEFYNVLDMIGEEPLWEARITTNLSPSMEKLAKTKLARTGRLNINASFHPYQAKIEKFLEKLLFLRKQGIECSVVYVMYPPLLKRFGKDFEIFTKYGFIVHVRRFRGTFKGKYYPCAYTDEERRFVAKYCDDATIKYMLNEEPSFAKLTYTGMDFVIVDNVGNIKYCDDYRQGHDRLGNIFQNTVNLFNRPIEFPAENSSDGTVDGVANFLELNYRQLTGNNVLNFSKQGGVFKGELEVRYKNIDKDFTDSKIRAEYDFPPRNIKDLYYIIKTKKLSHFIKKYRYNRQFKAINISQRRNKVIDAIRKHPILYKIGKIIYSKVRINELL